MSTNEKERIANFRFRVIAALICRRFDSLEEERQARKELLDRMWDFPDGTTGKIPERTIRLWLARYRKGGIDGLYDRFKKRRADRGVCRALSPGLLAAAEELKRQVPERSVKTIIKMLRSRTEFADCLISRSTLGRYLQQLGIPKDGQQNAGGFQRWEQLHVNNLWQGDTAHGVWLPDPRNPKKVRRTKLIIFLDDASRVCTHGQFYFDEQLPSLLDTLAKAMLKRGKPSRLLLDNAYIFHSTTLESMCSALKVELSFCTARRPQGKGKIERLIRTTKSGFYLEASRSGYTTLEQLNEAFFAWLEVNYHAETHEELGITPLQRWQQDSDRIVAVTPEVLRRALMLRAARKVHINTAIITLEGEQYQASPHLAGKLVEIRWHTDDMESLEIWSDGKCIEIAKRIAQRPTFVPRKVLPEEPPSYQPLDSSKRYLEELIAQVPKLKPEPITWKSDEYLSCQELIHLLVQCLERPLNQVELDGLSKFFRRLAPIRRSLAVTAFRQAANVKGSALHPRYYLQHLERIVQGERR